MTNAFTIDAKDLAPDSVDPRWAKGPFLSLKMLFPKQKGAAFEHIAQKILTRLGEKVTPRTSSEHDFCVNGHSCELKGSTTTKGTDNVYSFLQIRPDQEYEFLVLTTFCFDGSIEIYRIPKNDVNELIEKKVFKKQHGGNKAESRTFCYNGTLKPFANYLWYKGKHEQ